MSDTPTDPPSDSSDSSWGSPPPAGEPAPEAPSAPPAGEWGAPPAAEAPASGDWSAPPPPPVADASQQWGDQGYATAGVPAAAGYGVPAGYEQKQKLVAGLLGVFLGAWGIHSFYLGDSKKGIIQIVVTVVTCGIGGLWGFIEGILILMGNINTDANGVPLRDN